MSTKHTPGPWSVKETPESSHQDWIVTDDKGRRICALYTGGGSADANLIAAAPDLLAALIAVTANGKDSAPGLGAYLKAQAAIAKATGHD